MLAKDKKFIPPPHLTSSSLREVITMKLLMYNPPRSSHPLHIPRSNNPHVPEGISVLHLTLKGEGYGLKAAVRVLTDALGAAGVYGKFFWRGLERWRCRV